MEKELVTRENVPFTEIPAAGLHGVGILKAPGNAWQLLKGVHGSRRILREFQPDVMLFTGGYVAVPMAVAGRGKASLLYVPDIEPGLALKFLSKFSTNLALTAEPSRRFFPSGARVEITGYPTRPDLKPIEKSKARDFFGINSDKKVVFVYGGSKGARSINEALWQNLPSILDKAEVIHLTGSLDWPRVAELQASLEKNQSGSYHPYPYLHEEMSAAFSAADLAICRAGASTLGELPLFGLPAILVPYPFAWRYQKVNADYLASHKAATIIRNEDLAEQLMPAVQELINNPAILAGMSAAAAALAMPDAGKKIAKLLLRMSER